MSIKNNYHYLLVAQSDWQKKIFVIKQQKATNRYGRSPNSLKIVPITSVFITKVLQTEQIF